MKVFVHYYDECCEVGISESPYAEVELDFAPMVGDLVWISEEAEQKLYEGALVMYREKRERMYESALVGKASELIKNMPNAWDYITPEIFEENLSFDGYMYVVRRLFVSYNHSEALLNGLHIFLYCDDNIPN